MQTLKISRKVGLYVNTNVTYVFVDHEKESEV